MKCLILHPLERLRLRSVKPGPQDIIILTIEHSMNTPLYLSNRYIAHCLMCCKNTHFFFYSRSSNLVYNCKNSIHITPNVLLFGVLSRIFQSSLCSLCIFASHGFLIRTSLEAVRIKNPWLAKMVHYVEMRSEKGQGHFLCMRNSIVLRLQILV